MLPISVLLLSSPTVVISIACFKVSQSLVVAMNLSVYAYADLMFEGSTTGGANWMRIKKRQTRKIVDDNQEVYSSEVESTAIIKERSHESSCKQHLATTYNTVVYGLPHITFLE